MTTIPFVEQLRPDGCAAAALCMVYRSFGLDCEPEELWTRVSGKVNGVLRGKTQLLCKDALTNGFEAIIVQPRAPWQTLLRCMEASTRVILHHRLSEQEATGHYSVLLDIGENGLILHDPMRGPNLRYDREQFLRLWSSCRSGREVVGQLLVAIGTASESLVCSDCNSMCPESVPCVSCAAPICLRPGEVVGCLSYRCPGRRFVTCYCPYCDTSNWWMGRRAMEDENRSRIS